MKISFERLYVISLLIVVAFLVLYPVGMIFFGSIRDTAPGLAGHFSLDGYAKIFRDPDTYTLLLGTLWLAIIRTVLIVVTAVFLAWAVSRTNIPYRGLLKGIIIFAFFMPYMPKILAWIIMLNSRTGLINQAARTIFPLGDEGPFNVYSYGGIIFTSVLLWTPILFILLVPVFEAMDASLEEQSRMSGASIWRTIWHIDVPLARPALLAATALAFVRMIESFTVELVLGIPAKIYVLTTKIYNNLAYTEPPLYPPAMALAVGLLVITIIIVAIQWKLLGQRQYGTVTGKGFRVAPVDLRKFKYLVFSGVLLFIFLNLVLPLGVLLWGSFTKIAGVFMPNMYTLAHYRYALSTTMFTRSIVNTLVIASISATVAMVLCSLVGYVVVKTNFRERRPLDLVTWLPWAIPSIVLALGMLWAYILLPLPFGLTLYGTTGIIIVAFVTKGFPMGTRTMTSTMIQITKELEESSRIHGASWTQTFTRIMLPLVSPGFMSGWLILFTLAAKDLDTVILLYNSRSIILSTLMYEWWWRGELEEAFILGLIQAAIITVAYTGATLLGRKILPPVT
ncbi:MAG: iron ABC transporter permease [Chloroflexi bacterium]|nr:iron ABC transporter permease [Chloroflexota bacterium]